MIARNLIALLALVLESPAHGQIVLERTSCFGTCPAYEVEVRPDGSVLFTGRNRFALPSGKRKIDAAMVDSLTAEITRSAFVGLADSYKSGEPGCKAYATDHPSIVLRVSRGLHTKRVSYDLGCYGDSLPQDSMALREMFDHPPSARTLVQRLAAQVDAVAGVGEWLRRPRVDRH
jgi:hypothetical protein